jgi:hypothetical protein
MYPFGMMSRAGQAAAVALVAAVTVLSSTGSQAQIGGAGAPARDTYTR